VGETLVVVAVKVVLPCSMWPMVPMFTCGLLRSNFSLAIFLYPLLQIFCIPQLQNDWSGGRDLNPQPSPWKSETLPLSYPRPGAAFRDCKLSVRRHHLIDILEPGTG